MFCGFDPAKVELVQVTKMKDCTRYLLQKIDVMKWQVVSFVGGTRMILFAPNGSFDEHYQALETYAILS